MKLKIIPTDLLEEYTRQVPENLHKTFDALKDAEISTNTFSFYVSVSSVFSSKIEGEDIELDSYIKHKRFGIAFLPDYTKKIDDLYSAYTFAKSNQLNQENIEFAHQFLSKHLVATHFQGKIRTQNMYVTTSDGKIEYVATSPFEVKNEMQKLYDDIDYLLKQELSFTEIFYFASMIHLVFLKIHPFNDGNGRTARLIEKWFLAQKLGEKAWFIQCEKHYYSNHQSYYHNIRKLGIEYQNLDFSQAISFLLMLPNSLQK